ncbi:hypothetical protein TrLO_g5374 [Triparma laevis f. longispina]|uniref:ADP-ribosylation factor n=2 Tax=Triparma laevis TaxID=1534972 RepID=A0A9W7DSS3_9STRA|nr:hypothetical protein TrLO_g5374 [Triparma laevis f. longispina]
MGLFVSRIIESFSGLQEKRLLLLGLDAAGKTTLLYSLKLNECVHSVPTVGFNVEHITYKKMDMTMWDVGGQDKIRRLWNHYYRGTDALIYVVDSCDRDRMEEARFELHKILTNDEVKQTNRAVLVYANKQDLPGALNPAEVVQKLELNSINPSLEWYCQGSTATNGGGLYEGLDWLNNTLTKQKSSGQRLRF